MVLIPIKVPEPAAEAEDAISPANSLKRRLLGAAVLLALGVIVLPLLLDGSGTESRFRRVETVREYPPKIIGADGQPELQIPKPVAKEPVVAAAQAPTKQPAKPRAPVELQTPVKPEPGANAAAKSVAAQSRSDNSLLARLEQVLPEQQQEAETRVRAVRQNSPSAEIDAALERLGERSPDSQSGNVMSSGSDAGFTGLTTNRSVAGSAIETAAWVVQAGSFADEENALRLRDTLRNRGFPSFVATVGDRDIVQTLRYRVQVGPMADRQNAELRQREIERITGGSALVREYR